MEDRPWFKFYDPGVREHIDYPSVPLFHFLEESARKYPNRPCVVFKGGKISYAEMDELTDRLAAAFAAMGVKKGDPVGIFMPNTPQFVIAYYAILKAGGIVVATNFLYTPREIEHQLNDAGVEVMIVLSNFYEKVKEVQPKTKLKKLIVTNIKAVRCGRSTQD
jgi:long-chain acyl-CoA synthetase